MFVPSYEEQMRISFFFRQIDNLITTKEQEIEKLQNLKKAFLEKMFV